MSSTTTRYALYLAGGGSSGTITPDEIVDIDKINGNFKSIDAALGVPVVARTSIAAPAQGQAVKDPANSELYVWYQSAWIDLLPGRLIQTNLDSTYIRQDNPAVLDNRYYTQTRLANDGVLDSRYLLASGTHSQSRHDFKIVKGNWTAQTTANGRGFEKSQRISFGYTFATPPEVVMTPHTTAQAEQHFGANSIDTTGFTAYYFRTDTTDCVFSWIAMGT